MAKLKEEPITMEDVAEYLDSYSDFTFEIKTLNLLTKLGFKCKHSGTYTDPITQRMREFDIRAVFSKKVAKKLCFNLFLAVECKNLKEYFPLVVHCLPRTREESFEEMIFFYENQTEKDIQSMIAYRTAKEELSVDYATTLQQHRTLSIYERSKPVGKSCDQVGRHDKTKEIQTSDSDVFEKISQALNSSYDLVQDAARFQEIAPYNVSVVKPILVVPDGTLWQVLYDENGEVVAGPEQTDYVSYFYGKMWPYKDCKANKEYVISHLDIVTLNNLQKHVSTVLGFEGEDVLQYLQQLQQDGQLADKIQLK